MLLILLLLLIDMRAVGSSVKNVAKLGFVFETLDPFLFCVHHKDNFPAPIEDGRIDPKLLKGRNIGSDFGNKDFNMYHAQNGIPGFPVHPHFGFETITIVVRGTVDHHDSLGACARFGKDHGSDTQWVTTGSGVSHSEMFPLLNSEKKPDGESANFMELFQIWINLPAKSKQAKAYFTMLWTEKNPVLTYPGAKVTVIADEEKIWSDRVQSPPPSSWASEPGSKVAILLVELDPGAEYTLPKLQSGNANRKIFFYKGSGSVSIDGQKVDLLEAATLDCSMDSKIVNSGNAKAFLLFLQGKPIGEPVVQRGPFVTNTKQEMELVMQRYQRTQFGGWKWPSDEPTHPRNKPRFAKHGEDQEEVYPDNLKE